MRLILEAARPDTKNVGAANFRVYLKLGCQANRGTRWDAENALKLGLINVRFGKDGSPPSFELRRVRQTRPVFQAHRKTDAAVGKPLAAARDTGGGSQPLPEAC